MRLLSKVRKMTMNRYIAASFVMIISLLAPMTELASPNTALAQAVNLDGKQIQDISTGYDAACAVIESWPYCWGANDLGQLGNGKTSDDPTTKPTPVSKDTKGKPAGNPVCVAWTLIFCTKTEPGPPAVPPSALVGLDVEKVSVGYSHACAIASAKVYCWGDNEFGQLGHRSTAKYSASPVKVETNNSALAQKEIIDVSAGEEFTCALASDGTVACWGNGDDGRLGTGNNNDVNYPRPVLTTASSPLAGKKAVKLARASDATMCVLAVSESNFASVSNKGNPYCWGYGIGDGTVPGPGRVTVPCSKNTPTTRPTGSGVSYTYFSSSTPVEISGTQQFTQIDGNTHVTGLADNNRAYYWGMNGYKSNNTYVSTTTCSVNPCTSQVLIQNDVTLAYTKSKAKPAAKKKKNTTSIGKNQRSNNKNNSDNDRDDSCDNVTHYGYTADRTNERIGKMTPTVPKTTSLNQTNLRAMAGNIESGLFCATNASGTFCDTNGTSADEGQTGSGYTKKCTPAFLWISASCEPGPTGPQQVVSSGWLNGKTVQQLSTGLSGYTCALANNSIGCWGANHIGQLGIGNTTNKNVPTALKLN